jgi:hypothetical protein
MSQLGWNTEALTWGTESLVWEEPVMHATYAPRCYVHPDRYGNTKTSTNRLLVVHTSEGGELGTSAEALCSYMGQPGDRSNPDGSKYGASYQYVIDTDVIRPAALDTVVAYAAAGANHDGIHYCIPGKAGQTRNEWLDTNTRPHIANLARALADKAAETGIPLRKLTTQEVRDGMRGVCGHVNVSLAFGRSDHTDPGAFFPWDVLFDDIARLTEGDDMTPEIPPRRLLDTRPLPSRIPAGQPVEVETGRTGKAVAVNITVTQPEGNGFVTAWGAGAAPGTSNVNYAAGQTIANHSVVPLDGTKIRFQIGGAPTHVVIDLQGVYV